MARSTRISLGGGAAGSIACPISAIIDYNKISPPAASSTSEHGAAGRQVTSLLRVRINSHNVDELNSLPQPRPSVGPARAVIYHTVKGKGIGRREQCGVAPQVRPADAACVRSAAPWKLERKRSLDTSCAGAPRRARGVHRLRPVAQPARRDEEGPHATTEGISEANIIGMAAGMAWTASSRQHDATYHPPLLRQVAIDLCLHDLPVRLIGNGGGYVYAPLGPTHQAIEDIAIMRALPHMTVTAACDAEEMSRLMEATLDWPHPVYIRLGKGGDPVISDAARGFAIGKAIDMIEEAHGASDVLLVTTGVATTQALQAAEGLAAEDPLPASARSPSAIDVEAIAAAAASTQLKARGEEHSVVGGLGSAVLELLSDALSGRLPPVKRLGIPDRFSAHYGSQAQLMKDCNIDADGIAAAARSALKASQQ